MTAAALRSWGMDDEVPAIELAVSELLAHAVRNGAGPADLRLSAEGDTIRLEVMHLGDDVAAPRPERGRQRDSGLWFVDEVADDWGVDDGPGATRVWLTRRCTRHPHPGVHPD